MEKPISTRTRNGPSAFELQVLEAAASYYQEVLSRELKVQEVLEKLGLRDPGLLRECRIGYSDGSLPRDRESCETLRRLGLLNGRGGESLLGSLVFPLENGRGEIVSFSGWRLGQGREVSLESPHTGIFNASRLKGAERIFLTGSALEALTLISLGFKDVLALDPRMGFTEEHVRLLKTLSPREAGLFLRPGPIEKEAREKLKNRLSPGMRIFKVNLPDGIKNLRTFLLRGIPKERLLAGAEEIQAAQDPPEGSDSGLEEKEGEILFRRQSRLYRIRPLARASEGTQKVRLRLKASAGSHLDLLELESARQREGFAKMGARLLGLEKETIERELGDLAELFELHEARRRFENECPGRGPAPRMTAAERDEAVQFLKDPRLIERIVEDARAIGHVGEEDHFLLAYLVSVSRKLARPLGLLILSQSGAGKTALQERILLLTPPEDQIRLTRLTDQALFYQEKDSLRHKLIAIEEAEGAEGAGYSIRNLLSGQGLTSLTTLKEEGRGRPVSKSHEVEGPSALMMTSTRSEMNYETYNRFIVTAVDESPRQTQAILKAQRFQETLEGLLASRRQGEIRKRHHNVQRLLQGYAIVNPHAERLGFSGALLRARREQVKYHSLIRAVP